MLQPKRMKHRKMMKRTHGGLGGVAMRGNTIAFGEFAIRTVEPAWITARQIEAARRTITHHLKRGGKVWIRIFPDKVVTSKPAETRMGSGKGAPDHYVAVVKPGPRAVRDRRRAPGAGAGGAAAGLAQAAGGHQIHDQGGPRKWRRGSRGSLVKNQRVAEARKLERPVANPEVRLRELHEEMFKLRFQFATRQLTNTARIRRCGGTSPAS